MKRIGIYGGTFDPIHLGHLIIAETCYNTFQLDSLRIIPAYQPPHKTDRSFSAEDRLAMLELALEDNPHLICDKREIVSKEKNYSLHTIIDIKNEFPSYDIYYLVGEDSIMNIDSWYRWRELLEMVHCVIARRPASVGDVFEKVDMLKREGFRVSLMDDYMLDISSSKIRKGLAEGLSMRYLIPDKVYEYILDKGLYGTEVFKEM